jgi:hypothetical protein
MEMSVQFHANVVSSPEKIKNLYPAGNGTLTSSRHFRRYTELLQRPANATCGFMETGISLFNRDMFTGDDGFAARLVTDGASPDICRENMQEEINFMPLAVLINAIIFKAMLLSSTATNLGYVEKKFSIWRLPKDPATK